MKRNIGKHVFQSPRQVKVQRELQRLMTHKAYGAKQYVAERRRPKHPKRFYEMYRGVVRNNHITIFVYSRDFRQVKTVKRALPAGPVLI